MINLLVSVKKMEWNLSFKDKCPWIDMADSERSKSKNIRGAIFRKLNVNDDTVTCWLLGINCPVKVAHILPDSTKAVVYRRLGLPPDFRNQIEPQARNFMILHEKLEQAFDNMSIAFAPNDPFFPNQLYMKIWSDDIRDVEVVEGINFKDLENRQLMVPDGWSLSLRCLSYHNLCCYIYNKTKRTMLLDPGIPADFSSVDFNNKEKDNIRKDLVSNFHLAMRVEKSPDDDNNDYDLSLLNSSDNQSNWSNEL